MSKSRPLLIGAQQLPVHLIAVVAVLLMIDLCRFSHAAREAGIARSFLAIDVVGHVPSLLVAQALALT